MAYWGRAARPASALERLCVGRGYVAALQGARKTSLDAETRVPEIITTGETLDGSVQAEYRRLWELGHEHE